MSAFFKIVLDMSQEKFCIHEKSCTWLLIRRNQPFYLDDKLTYKNFIFF